MNKLIKEYNIKELTNFSLDLLRNTYLELGQNPSSQDRAALSVILAKDLKIDFGKLSLEDITHSFRDGVRNHDEFYLTVKTYYKWVKAHQKIICDNEPIAEEYRDRRLNYRNRKNTGLLELKNLLK
tara:strand:+ start:2040 stop:2417 length:378 start_codon:yes stop_codon:yes gene_type:complete